MTHLTPDVLAAWMDGTLSDAERSAAETHASDCAQCQAVLATMVRIQPLPQHRAWWSVSGIRWLVPAAAAVLVAVIASILPFVQQGDRTAAPEGQAQPMAARRSAEPSTASPRADPSTRAEPPAAFDDLRAAPQAKPQDAKALRQKSKDLERSASAKAPSKVGALEDRADKQDANAAAADSVTASAPSATPAPPSSPAAAGSQLAPSSNAAATPLPQERAPASPPSLQESVTVKSEDALKKAAPRAAMAAAAVRPLEVISPERSYRWRAVSPGSILYSMDSGISWRATSASVAVAMRAGSAPARNVCWLVGDSGTILLTTDGQNWQVRSFPERVDLTDVQAADARTATVTTASRRRFTTTDGGATWSPLQEN